jgi:hypothetical protein
MTTLTTPDASIADLLATPRVRRALDDVLDDDHQFRELSVALAYTLIRAVRDRAQEH